MACKPAMMAESIRRPVCALSPNPGRLTARSQLQSATRTGTYGPWCRPLILWRPRLSPLLEARWAVLAVSLYEGSGHFGSIAPFKASWNVLTGRAGPETRRV